MKSDTDAQQHFPLDPSPSIFSWCAAAVLSLHTVPISPARRVARFILWKPKVSGGKLVVKYQYFRPDVTSKEVIG